MQQLSSVSWFSCVTKHDTLSETVLQSTLEGGENCGGQEKNWLTKGSELLVPCWTCLMLLKTGLNGGLVSYCIYLCTALQQLVQLKGQLIDKKWMEKFGS